MESNSDSSNKQPIEKKSKGGHHRYRGRPRKGQEGDKATKKSAENPKVEKKQKDADDSDDDSEDEELCFICTEPVTMFAVSECDHRTCHRCSLRLRALYETRNCAYCKTEQKQVIFTKDAEKPFANYVKEDVPFVDEALDISFETQEMKDEALDMLKHNCPQCKETMKDWSDLKQHVKKVHELNLCDLCIRHKKIFPFEHTLYTNAQLNKHYKDGDKSFNEDDESGFTGHPECAFCKSRFYGDDELFIHCRDMHEQCFLCVRNGKRHEYYVNYESLEEHFKSDHCLCLHPQCLEKKFIVFDSPIDLKAHEVEVHGDTTSGLQRSMQTENRRLELNFQYDSYHSRMQQQRGNNNNNNNNRKNTKKTNNEDSGNSNRSNNKPSGSRSEATSSKAPAAPAAPAPALSGADFPSIGGSSNKTTSANQPRVVPGASKKGKGKQNAIQKPSGFGALSTPNPAAQNGNSGGGGGGGGSSSGSSNSSGHPEAVVDRHKQFLNKLESILQSKEKIAEFRSLTGSYRKSNISGEEYVNKIVALANNKIDNCSKIFRGVEELLDIEEKKHELVRIWRNKHTEMSQFPALETKIRASPEPSRVLVIKGPKKPQRVVGRTANIWDKVASAASVAKNTSSTTTHGGGISSSGSSRPSSTQNSARSSPQSSRPASPAATFRAASSTAWGGSSATGSGSSTPKKTKEKFPALKSQAFPSLPTAAPKHEMILNMRRTASGTDVNAWGSSASNQASTTDDDSSTTSNNSKKKKGRQNKVLFRVGL